MDVRPRHAAGGIVATFIDSLVEPTFWRHMPVLQVMPCRPRQVSLLRLVKIPSRPFTSRARSTSSCSIAIDAALPRSLGPR
ncbi:MAG: hypothetical protein U0800_19370 [Isosphaeraceae bacterium]